MRVITQIYSFQEYELFKKTGVNEFILGLKGYALNGETGCEELISMVRSIRESDSDSHLFLDMDLLITEADFEDVADILSKVPLLFFNAIRVRDLGLANHITTLLTHPVHLICESGVRNFSAIKAIQEALGPLLHRIVLPYEVTGETLKEWSQDFGCEMEILGVGPLRLFYSRRKLLSPLIHGPLPCHAQCSTSFIRNRDLFDVVENDFGTRIYFSKDLSLLPYWQELSHMGIQSFRIDRYFNRATELIEELLQYLQTFDPEILRGLKEKWKRPWIHGFYKANQTGRNYEPEQEKRQTESDEIRIGEVFEASKGNYLIACFEMNLCLPLKVTLKTPLNHKGPLSLESVKDFRGNLQLKIERGIPYLLPYAEGITAKTQILLQKD